jgi:hypothetical protein
MVNTTRHGGRGQICVCVRCTGSLRLDIFVSKTSNMNKFLGRACLTPAGGMGAGRASAGRPAAYGPSPLAPSFRLSGRSSIRPPGRRPYPGRGVTHSFCRPAGIAVRRADATVVPWCYLRSRAPQLDCFGRWRRAGTAALPRHALAAISGSQCASKEHSNNRAEASRAPAPSAGGSTRRWHALVAARSSSSRCVGSCRLADIAVRRAGTTAVPSSESHARDEGSLARAPAPSTWNVD